MSQNFRSVPFHVMTSKVAPTLSKDTEYTGIHRDTVSSLIDNYATIVAQYAATIIKHGNNTLYDTIIIHCNDCNKTLSAVIA